MQETKLPTISWRKCTKSRVIRLLEEVNVNGNVRIGELGILSHLSRDCKEGTRIFEIGTFDGRTTINLSLNAPLSCRIYTLDLPPNKETVFYLDKREKHFADKPEPGLRYKKYTEKYKPEVGRIYQLLGDSADFDYKDFFGKCSLVFVDGSHAYEYVKSDTYKAMQLVDDEGCIIWHDYGVWEGVTRALEEIEEKEHWGLKNIAGTSLVYWGKRS